MEPIKRRDFLCMAGTGYLAGLLYREAEAQVEPRTKPATDKATSSSLPNLTTLALKAAATQDDLNADYFWRDSHTIVFLRLVPKKDVFRAVLIDTITGQKTLPQEFNAKNSPLMKGQKVGVGVVGSHHWEYSYSPPKAQLSPDGKWLLWNSTISYPQCNWIAATLEGQSQQWKQGSDPTSEMPGIAAQSFWLRDSNGWVELVCRYAKRKYTLTQANVYRLGNPNPIKTISIGGLEDGLPVGVTQNDQVMLFHPSEPKATHIKQVVFSLVRLDADTVMPQKLTVSIPMSSSVWDIILSPQGDRLAWILEGESEQTRLFTLYLSSADGSQMRAVGAAEGVAVGKGYSWPRAVRWFPDGKHLSFIYKNAIWTIPAE